MHQELDQQAAEEEPELTQKDQLTNAKKMLAISAALGEGAGAVKVYHDAGSKRLCGALGKQVAPALLEFCGQAFGAASWVDARCGLAALPHIVASCVLEELAPNRLFVIVSIRLLFRFYCFGSIACDM